jgi:hypothetical protein
MDLHLRKFLLPPTNNSMYYTMCCTVIIVGELGMNGFLRREGDLEGDSTLSKECSINVPAQTLLT